MKKLLVLSSLCLVLVGCAGTSLAIQTPFKFSSSEKFSFQINPQVDVSAEALEIMNERIQSQLAGSLDLPSSQGVKKVQIAIISYRMRDDVTRALVGIFAGTDYITSQVTVTDGTTANVIAGFTVKSLNDSAWGPSRSLIERHADNIVSYLKNGRP